MAGNLIATSSKIAMQPLAFQGIMVYMCFPQIRDMLYRKFGDDYVLLFARPAENAGDGKIDWYSPVQGQPRKLKDLPEDEAQPIRERMGQMAAEIAKYAEELIETREPLKVTRGNILNLALTYPDDDALYVVGGQPVYTCWGFGPGTPGVEGKYLTRLANAAPVARAAAERGIPPETAAPAPVKAPPPAGRKWGFAWLWWLFPLLAAILLFLLLFSSFGPVKAISGVTLFQWPAFWRDSSGQSYDIENIKAQVNDLRMRLDEHIALCKPEQKALPQKQEELIIPENAQNTEFLEGEWRCDTGLANAATKEPVQLAFSFDKTGNGTATTNEKDGQCHGPVKASLQSGVLHIEIGEQSCPNGSSYNPVSIDCRPSGSGAACQGTHGRGSSWGATFYKVK